MTRRTPPGRTLRAAALAAFAAFAPTAGALAAGSPIPELRPSPRPRGDHPMRILRVTSSDKACGPNCPEWISAEGIVTPGSASAFASLVAGLGGRRLPVLISSHGGSVRDALEMGALIRTKGLAVAVARTLIVNCSERARACPDPRGEAIVGGATCASACPLILAGGVERLIGSAPLVGVHQITTVMKETEGVAGLTKTVRVYEQGWVDRTVEDYLTRMGVGDPVMALLRKTPAASIRWLSLDEIAASGLATGGLDSARPILAEGANGLDGRGFGEPPKPDLLVGNVADRQGAGANLAFTYRRGGGALELALTDTGTLPPPSPTAWTLAFPGGAALELKAAGNGTARGLLPRVRFCALGRDGLIVATPAPAAAPERKPVAFALATAADVAALFDEACP